MIRRHRQRHRRGSEMYVGAGYNTTILGVVVVALGYAAIMIYVL